MARVTETPLIHIKGLRKHFGALRPLRLNALSLMPGERLILRGLDEPAAEMLAHLVTGASVPDEGLVCIAGRDTREIATDTEWLTSLDLFGMVTNRAVLLDSLPIEANLALPFTLSIDPLSPDIRDAVVALAEEVGLTVALVHPVSGLSGLDLARVHLARALAPNPKVLVLEHPTAKLAPGDASALGRLLSVIGERRGLAWLALTEDETFIKALGGRRCRVVPASGDVKDDRRWRIW